MNYAVREATVGDIPSLCELAEAFHAEMSAPLEWSAAAFSVFANSIIEDETGFAAVLVNEAGAVVGALLGRVEPWAFGRGEIAREVMWYVMKPHRGNALPLLHLFEAWAAKRARATIVDTYDGRAGALYQRRGYQKTSSSWARLT